MVIYACDIGTCCCKLCRYDGEHCEMIPVTDGFSSYWGDNKLLISAAYADGENGDELLIGQDAYNKCLLHPEWYIDEFKRQFGQTRPVLFTDTAQITTDDIYIAVLRQMGEIIRERDSAVDLLVVTHPAAYAGNKSLIQRLVNAANSAGFFEVETIDEPTAAAVCFNSESKSIQEGEKVLVYDWGGGTFDTALDRMTNGTLQPLNASLGLNDCGGADIDALIQNDIVKQLVPAMGADAQTILASKQFQAVLQKTAIQVKHRLSNRSTVTEPILVSFDRTIPYTLTRQDFNRMIFPLVARTTDVCRKLVSSAGFRPEEIQRVVLVGGTSQIPLVSEQLKALFPNAEVGKSTHPEYMVCQGAAISANLSEVERTRRRAENGDPNAMTWLAISYFQGDEEELGTDHKAAFHWAKKGAELDNADAQFLLSFFYRQGLDFMEPDEDAALFWLKKSAEGGNDSAQDRLGDYYEEQDDPQESFRWHMRAAENGNGDAAFSVGMHYLQQNEHDQAYRWFLRSAQQDVPEAQYSLGIFYEDGLGPVEKDTEEAFRWYMKAAEQGNAAAQNEVARWYYFGKPPVGEDNDMAFLWGMKAAQQGDPDAQAMIGECFEKGFGTPISLDQALSWYQNAAEQDNSHAQARLARWYYYGDGPLPEDNDQAFLLAKKAAEKGEQTVWAILAECYERGFGTKKNEEKAFKWYKKAAVEADSPISQYKVAFWYYNGNAPVKKNGREAYRWAKKSAEHGNASGQMLVGMCFDEGTGVQMNKSTAFDWYLKAAQQGLAIAQRFVGIDYMIGEGTTKNFQKAEEWLRKAVGNGDEEAASLLRKLGELEEIENRPDPKIIFRRDKRALGGARPYAVRIDQERIQDLRNGTSFTCTVDPGSHFIEVANGPVLGSSVDWSSSNCIVEHTFSFSRGDILLIDVTMGDTKVEWQ